jgi:predicted RNA binding protein YcfA (HicA-like mRNA interferase family)
MKFRDIVRVLLADDWYLVATEGSHRQYKHPVKLGRVTVAGQPGQDVPRGTLRSIYRQAGLSPQRGRS